MRSALRAEGPLPEVLRALVIAAMRTPSAPALPREIVEHIEVSKRRTAVNDLRAQIAALFGEMFDRRRTELRSFEDKAATLFVLEHALEATIHAATFYRPEGMSLERAVDAVTRLLVRELMP